MRQFAAFAASVQADAVVFVLLPSGDWTTMRWSEYSSQPVADGTRVFRSYSALIAAIRQKSS